MIALVSSDWHLDGMIKVLHNPLAYQIKEIEKLYEYAVQSNIKNIFVPGDLTHTPTMSDDTVIALTSLLYKYDGIINTYYIAGNHDYQSAKKTSVDLLQMLANLKFLKTLKVFTTPTLMLIDDVPVSFLPFPHLEPKLSKRPTLIFAHIDTPGAVSDSGYKLKDGHKVKRRKCDYIISGHIHQHQYLASQRTLYGGTLYQTKFDEELPKGFLHIDVESTDTLDLDYLFIGNKPSFELKTHTVNSDEDWDDLSEDQNVRYKLTVNNGVVVPKEVMSMFKNITALQFPKSKAGVAPPTSYNNDIKRAQLERDVTDGLPEYLISAGFTKTDVSRGIDIVKSVIAELPGRL
jgi:DNA repair exonuclease SbcCD nuclease subunit